MCVSDFFFFFEFRRGCERFDRTYSINCQSRPKEFIRIEKLGGHRCLSCRNYCIIAKLANGHHETGFNKPDCVFKSKTKPSHYCRWMYTTFDEFSPPLQQLGCNNDHRRSPITNFTVLKLSQLHKHLGSWVFNLQTL